MTESEQGMPRDAWWRRLVDWDGSGHQRRVAAHRAYVALVGQARAPTFYSEWGVPDTNDGRFEMIGLHVMLVIRRLRALGAPGEILARELLEVMIADLDRSLREIGVGDLSVGKRVQGMVRSFLGRVAAIEPALDKRDPAPIETALERNLYQTGRAPEPMQVTALAGYLIRQDRALDAMAAEALLDGRLEFAAIGDPPLPHEPARASTGKTVDRP
jgi:cytochrome b pre-mRNA-processing protein 3